MDLDKANEISLVLMSSRDYQAAPYLVPYRYEIKVGIGALSTTMLVVSQNWIAQPPSSFS